MIIIKTIILYFIQIRHTDDFPSTGTRIVSNNIPSSHRLRWQHTLNNLPLDVSYTHQRFSIHFDHNNFRISYFEADAFGY